LISTPSPEVIATQAPGCLPPVSPGDGVTIFKTCPHCKESKPLSEYRNKSESKDGKAYVCRKCTDKGINRDDVKDRCRRWYQKNRESVRAAAKEKYYAPGAHEARVAAAISNREAINKRSREYTARRIAVDREWRLKRRLRSRMNAARKSGYKTGSAVASLGCTIRELEDHLESQFLPGMTWANYGRGSNKWNIDHIVELKRYSHILESDRDKLSHYSNLRPMWSSDNAKRNRAGVSDAELLGLGLLNPDGTLTLPYRLPEKFPLRTLDTNAAPVLT